MAQTASDRFRERAHGLLERIDDGLHLVIAFGLSLLAMGFAVYIAISDFGSLLHDLVSAESDVPNAVLSTVNDVLFAVIVLEIQRTITAHLKEHEFALRPFIIIGIIAAVRHLLVVGARMSVASGGHPDPALFHEQVIEMALNGLLAVALVFAYWLIARSHAD